MSLQTYTKSLLDPFDKGMSQPKLLDGKVARSSGIRLRATGEITCNSSGSTYIALIPGASNVICWRVDDNVMTPEVTPLPFQGHLDSVEDRANVKATRTVGTALRLSLVNSADQNEGYWEAARIPSCALDFTFTAVQGAIVADGAFVVDSSYTIASLGTTDFTLIGAMDNVIGTTFTATGTGDGLGGGTATITTHSSALSLSLSSVGDLSNYSTYLTGKLRDIHRYQFKLNAIDNDINFNRCINEPPEVTDFVSEQWDTVLIKVHGRVEIGAPSMMMYDCISAQEVIYKENTALARLMSTSPYVPQTKSLLTRTRFNPPGVQIS